MIREELKSLNERTSKLPRQLKDKKREMLVVKNGKVQVIDKKDWKKYEKKGYLVAEKKNNKKKIQTENENPCWDGYKQVGMKTKNGRQVPNCVKESINEAKIVGSYPRRKEPHYGGIPTSKSSTEELVHTYIDTALISGYPFDDEDDNPNFDSGRQTADMKMFSYSQMLKKRGFDRRKLDKLVDIARKKQTYPRIEENLNENLNITGYYGSGKSPKMTLNVDKLNANSPLEKIIHAYLDSYEELENSEYGSYSYDEADSDIQYLDGLLRKKKISNKELNKVYKKFSRDKKYPVIAEQNLNETRVKQAVSGGKVHKFITAKNLTYKGKKYSDIEFELLGIDNSAQLVKLKILAPKNLFGQEMKVPFKTIRRGPFIKTDTSK